MSDDYQPFAELMKSKQAGHTRPEGDFAMFLKGMGGTPSLEPLANTSQTSGTASANLPSLDPVAIDATPQGKPTGSAREAAHAKPCHGPDTDKVGKSEDAKEDKSEYDEAMKEAPAEKAPTDEEMDGMAKKEGCC